MPARFLPLSKCSMRTYLYVLALALVPALPALGTSNELTLFPVNSTLRGKAARQRLIVTATKDGKAVDRTRDVRFESLTPKTVAVSADGIVTPLGDGAGIVVARLDGLEARATIKVLDTANDLPVTFEKDVQPILVRFACNSGACHGKARGQNGFQLSLLGFDADFDFAALTQEARGRRVFPAAPADSLLLLKAIGAMPHGGGRRLAKEDPYYEILRRWIAAGMPRTPKEEPTLERITVEPIERILATGAEQQLLITAHYSDKT